MKYVYIDESGDIGSTSSYIVFSAIITEHDRQLEKVVKKIWKAKPQYHKKGRLHSVDVDDATRTRMLSKMSDMDIVIKFRKFKKNNDIKKQSTQYYKELATFLKECEPATSVVVERKDTIRKRQKIIEKLDLKESFKNVSFGDPYALKQLQAVDFVAWSYGRMLEQKDSSFYKIIKDKHVE